MNANEAEIIELKKRIEGGENEILDFKFEISDSRKIARTICAFTNTKGGSLLIGVKDNKRIAGIRTEEEIYMAESAAKLYCKPEVSFKVKLWKVNNKNVLEIIIPESENKGYKALNDEGKWISWIRCNDQNVVAPSFLVKFWERKTNVENIVVRYDERLEKLFKLFKDKEIITISLFSKIAIIPYFQAENLFVDLLLLNVIKYKISDKGAFFYLSENIDETFIKSKFLKF